MIITIESTSKIVILVVPGQEVPARVWQGATADGIPVQCFIARIDRLSPRWESRPWWRALLRRALSSFCASRRSARSPGGRE